jgi:ABC-type glycerol-3-phosphate transport system substrate-binding protein
MKTVKVFSIIIIASMLLAACAPAAVPTAPPPVTVKETVVVVQEVVKEVAKEITAVPTSAPQFGTPTKDDPGAGLEQFDFNGITIRTIFWDIPYAHVMKDRLAKLFEEKTGAKVEWELGTEEEIRYKMELDNVSKSANYSMVLVDNWTLATRAESGVLTPIDDYYANVKYPWEFNVDDCQTCKKAMTYKGRLWGYPWALEVGQMAYRKDILEKYGVKVPTTTDELTAACKTLEEGFKKDNVDMHCIAMRARRGEDNPIQSAGWAAAYGGKWLDEKFVPQVNSPEYVAGITWFTDLLRNYGPPDVANYTWMEVQTAFAEEQVAIIIDGEPVTSRLQDPTIGAKVKDKMGWALPPKGPVAYPTHLFLPGWGINTFADQKTKDATWAYITWITSDAVLLNMIPDVPGTDCFPNPNVLEAIKATDPPIKFMIEAIPLMDPTYMPVIPEYPQLCDILGTYVSSIVAGEMDAKTAMDKAAKEMYAILEAAGYYK